MPWSPPSPCAEPGCPRLTHAARCEEHAGERRRLYRATPDRKAAKAFYASARWQRVRSIKLGQDPFCEAADCGELAVDVHHVKPWQDFPDLAFALENLESLCKRCHGEKRAARGRGGRRM